MKISQKSLLYRASKNIKQSGQIKAGDFIVLALSGGTDSVCLFDILFKLKDEIGFRFAACHYNHKLRGKASDADEKFVKKLCIEREVECSVGRAAEENLYKNEEEARNARYDFFENFLKMNRGAKVATAHNADDLAETLVLRLVRGTGLSGLCGIPSQTKKIIRPLLPFSRKEIEEYIFENKLEHQYDVSNKDVRYTRNYVRHQILPLLKKINPNLIETLYSESVAIGQDYDLLQALTEETFQKIADLKDNSVNIDRKKWLLLHPALKQSVIRFGIEKVSSLEDVTQKQILEVCEIIQNGEGKKFKLLPHSLHLSIQSGKMVIQELKKSI
jgi:tRNA(Ile)-lysidine synthase